jgi:parallel beta-helix repeat protein
MRRAHAELSTFALAFALVAVPAAPARANVVQIGPTDAAGVQAALNALAPGDTLELLPGTYDFSQVPSGGVEIAIPGVTIRGSEGTLLVGPGTDNYPFYIGNGFAVVADDVTVQSLHLQGFPGSSVIVGARPPADPNVRPATLILVPANGARVRSCTIDAAPGGSGISVLAGNDFEASDNVVDGSFIGIVVDGSKNANHFGAVSGTVRIHDNTIRAPAGQAGILFQASDATVLVQRNHVSDESSPVTGGIRVRDNHLFTLIEGNVLTGNVRGIYTLNCKDLHIINNVVTNSTRSGIVITLLCGFVSYAPDSSVLIRGNEIDDNGTAAVCNLAGNVPGLTDPCPIYPLDGGADRLEQTNPMDGNGGPVLEDGPFPGALASDC